MNTTNTSDLAPWFVTGFAEREGTFTYSRSARGLALYFGIRLAAADTPLLERIRTFFDEAGRIYSLRRQLGGSGWSYYRVTRRAELLRVVSHFDVYPLQGSKHEAFEVWREMVLLKAGPEPADAEHLALLAAQLSSLSPRNRARTA